MRNLLLFGGLLLITHPALAGPCLPGTLSDYILLGSTGCTLNQVQFFDFYTAPGQAVATPIDPTAIQVTPGGVAYFPTLLLTLNSTAGAGSLFETFFHYSATGDTLLGASIALGTLAVTGDGAITGVLDVCAGGLFFPFEPTGCTGSPGTAIAFAIDIDSQLSSRLDFPATSFFDVFVDISIDGGLNGFASLDAASVSATTPEPAPLLLTALALACFGTLTRHLRQRH